MDHARIRCLSGISLKLQLLLWIVHDAYTYEQLYASTYIIHIIWTIFLPTWQKLGVAAMLHAVHHVQR